MNKSDVLAIIDFDKKVNERLFQSERDANLCNSEIENFQRGYLRALKNIKEAVENYDES